MSVTSLLSTDSDYKSWLIVNLPLSRICQTIDAHNHTMTQHRAIIRPQGEINFPLGGMAFTYAFRWYLLGALQYWLPKTVAWQGLKQAGLQQKFLSHFMRPSGLAVMLLAEFDKAYREQTEGKWIEGDLSCLPTDNKFENTARDVQALYSGINHDVVFRPPDLNDVHANPSFDGSYLVGGADAQMISGDTLFDVRTTLKKEPETLANFLQQISYYLLDFSDRYGIKKLAWYYSRQRCYFVYPVEMFVSRELRVKFKEFLINRYDVYPGDPGEPPFTWDDYDLF